VSFAAPPPRPLSGRCPDEQHSGPPEGPFPYVMRGTESLVAWICPACHHILTTAVAA
jgi:hypothetical protein